MTRSPTLVASTLAALALERRATTPPRARVPAAIPERRVAAAPSIDGGPVPARAADDASVAPSPDASEPVLAEGATPPVGCFAWSPPRASAACAVERPGETLSELHLVVRFSSDPRDAVTPLGEGDSNDAPPPAALAALRARLAREGYVPLAALRRALPTGAEAEWAPGATARWQRRTTFAGGENAAPRYTDRVTLRWGAGARPLDVTLLEDRAVEDPSVTMYPIPDGRHLVLEVVGRFGDEGEYGLHARAWVCDREARACAEQ